MNLATVRSRYVIWPGSFAAALQYTRFLSIDVPGCIQSTLNESEMLVYGPVTDTATRTVFLLPAVNCIDANGADVIPAFDMQITHEDATEWNINGVAKTLAGTWYRCVVSRKGR